MEGVQKKMDVHMTMGNEQNLQFLTDMSTVITSNPDLIQAFTNESQFNEDLGEDIILVFHFYVEQGKEKQAKEYFEQALNSTADPQKMSPVQRPFQRPLNKGTVDVVEMQGFVIVKYRFFNSQMGNQGQLNELEQKLDKFQKVTLQSTVSLKGHLKHSNNNRTNVKVDYVDLRLSSDECSPSDFNKILQCLGIQEEELNFMYTIPALQMLNNLKSAQFEMKLSSFRQIKSYYNKACGQKFQKQQKPFNYVNRGLFRKEVACYGLYKNKFGIKCHANYNGEDVFMRLVKVYFIFLSKGLGL